MTLLAPATISNSRRWGMLAASTFAQTVGVVATNGPVFLIPALHDREHYSLAQAGLVAAAPATGVMVALVVWGWVADHRGERLVLLSGLAATTLLSALAALSHGLPLLVALLFLGGAAAASTNSASGRVVVGWFPPERRGLAMGIRQMGQPVGMGIAAISIAALAERYGVHAALWVPSIACLLGLVAVALVVIDPPRPERRTGSAPNPYRADSYLARIHGVSVLLVVPQFVVGTFALVWLVQSRHWTPAAAGAFVAVAQIAGALGRMGAGQLSDVVRSRMRPLRWVAIAAGVTMALLGVASHAWVALPLMVLASVLTVADNGLAFTAVAERAGPFWSGRALGVQNTSQFLTASFVPPLGGLAVTHWGYAWLFGAAALFPLVAIPLVPVGDEGGLS